MVLDCIDSLSLHPYFVVVPGRNNNKQNHNEGKVAFNLSFPPHSVYPSNLW